MSVKAISLPENRIIRIMDDLSKIIHNPIVTSVALVSCYGYYSIYANVENINVIDLKYDTISILINIVFILRFQCLYKFPLWLESSLFGIQNFACYNLLFTESLIYHDLLSTVFKACLTVQIIFPYLVLLMNIFEFVSFQNLLFNSNNYFLPIFISHSFVYINYLPKENSAIGLVFKVSQYSFKFYIIYQYFMHEIAQIITEEEFTDYSFFYGDPDVYNTKKSLYDNKKLMIGACMFGIAFNLGMYFKWVQ